jgi:hypothetical protein
VDALLTYEWQAASINKGLQQLFASKEPQQGSPIERCGYAPQMSLLL